MTACPVLRKLIFQYSPLRKLVLAIGVRRPVLATLQLGYRCSALFQLGFCDFSNPRSFDLLVTVRYYG